MNDAAASNEKLTIYLAGAITNQSDDDAMTWREDFKNVYGDQFHVISPKDKWPEMEQYKGTDDWPEAVVKGERRDIQNSNAVIARVYPSSMGTAIGITYAFLSGKTVVLYIPEEDRTDSEISPVLLFHKHAILNTFEGCVNFIQERHSRRSIEFIHKSAGEDPESFDEKIIVRAIRQAVDSLKRSNFNRFRFLDEIDPSKYADAVLMQMEDEVSTGTLDIKSVSTSDIRRITTSIFMNNAYRDEFDSLAKHYIRFREAEKYKNIADHHRKEASDIYTSFMHVANSKAGNIRRRVKQLDSSELNSERVSKITSAIIANLDEMTNAAQHARDSLDATKSQKIFYVKKTIEEWVERDSRLREKAKFVINEIDESLQFKMNKSDFENWIQVFVDNAFKHGKLEDQELKIFISASLDGDSNGILEIWNSGKQIDKRFADNFWDRSANQSSESSGWGKGLKLTHREVNQYGGSLTCTPCLLNVGESGDQELSASDFGSARFTIHLPEMALVSSEKRKVLIADDDDVDREEAADIMEDTFELLKCETIDEAIRVAESTPDLYGAFLDLDFGEKGEHRRDGVWLCKELRRVHPDLLIAMASGKNSYSAPGKHWVQRAEEAGANRTFFKEDYDPNDLLGVFS